MLVLIRILLINLSSRLCLYAGCTLVSKSAGFSIPGTYLALITLSSLISCMRLVDEVVEISSGCFILSF